jgi:protein-disulfide isomerase
MIRYVFALMVAGAMFFQVQPVFSQSAEELKSPKDQVKSLKDGQAGVKKDLQDVKAQLTTKPASGEINETVINVDGDPFKGSKDAKVAVIEFSDYQ